MRRTLRGIFRLSFVVVPFLAAGRLDWIRGWIFLALTLVTLAVNLTVIRKKNPGLLDARLKKIRPTKAFDKLFLSLLAITVAAFLTIAGLDARFAWSDMPLAWILPGIALHAAGMVAVAWTMAMNPFLETTVRIQNDRGHVVITSGPYAIVRHPMYAGVLLSCLGMPLVLGSWWTYVPAVLQMALYIFRTVFEDRTLRQELAGYEEYSARTPYRLVPGLW